MNCRQWVVDVILVQNALTLNGEALESVRGRHGPGQIHGGQQHKNVSL
jgi:hypothetical protein